MTRSGIGRHPEQQARWSKKSSQGRVACLASGARELAGTTFYMESCDANGIRQERNGEYCAS